MTIPGNVELFAGIAPAEVPHLLTCLGCRARTCRKGETVLREGDTVDFIGVVLFGTVQVSRTDHAGNRILLSAFGPGSVFAESLSCAGVPKSPVSAVSAENSSILLIPCHRLLRTCESACSFHATLIENLTRLLARKNLLLNSRIEIIAKRTIREKVLAFLEQERGPSGADTIAVRFSRNEMADFLCVDRSALSRELGAMQRDGLIRYEGNVFTLT